MKKSIFNLPGHRIYIAINTGLLASFYSAVCWLIFFRATRLDSGLFALAIGVFTGISIRFFSGGSGLFYRLSGVLFAFAGCFLGNILLRGASLAIENAWGLFQTFSLISPRILAVEVIENMEYRDIPLYVAALIVAFLISAYDSSPARHRMFGVVDTLSRSVKLWRKNIILSVAAVSAAGLIITARLLGNGPITNHYRTGELLSTGSVLAGERQGLWTVFHQNGVVAVKGYWKRGLVDSVWNWYNDHGEQTSCGAFFHGMRQGLWISYYANGEKQTEGMYEGNRKTGKWVTWFQNGKISEVCYYNRDRLDGSYRSYYQTGVNEHYGRYHDGRKNGVWTTWYRNGMMKIRIRYALDKPKIIDFRFSDGEQMVRGGNGIYLSIDENGRDIESIRVKDSIFSDTSFVMYPSGNLREKGCYVNGEYILLSFWSVNGIQFIAGGSGVYIQFYDSIGVDTSISGLYEKGRRNGLWRYWYRNRILMREEMYKGGKLNGPVRIWDPDGRLAAAGFMKDNERQGEWKWFHSDSTLESTARYAQGEKEGLQVFWSEQGKMIKKEYYKQGKLIREKSF